VLGLAGMLARRRVVLGIFSLSLVASFLFAFTGWAPAGSFLGPILGYPPFWARLLPMYLAGVVFFPQPRSHPSRHGYIAAGALGVLVVAAYIPLAWTVCFPLAGTYLLFWFGYHPGIHLVNFGKRGDFSYGTYLYAFPTQQLVMRFVGHPISPYLLSGTAVPLTLMAAILSWHLIEKRFVGSSPKVRHPKIFPESSPKIASVAARR
jgi:peptidoglycan/LPS O-acetylase OafA/YrhL